MRTTLNIYGHYFNRLLKYVNYRQKIITWKYEWGTDLSQRIILKV